MKEAKIRICKWKAIDLGTAIFVVNEANRGFTHLKFSYDYDDNIDETIITTSIRHYNTIRERIELKLCYKLITFLLQLYAKDYQKNTRGCLTAPLRFSCNASYAKTGNLKGGCIYEVQNYVWTSRGENVDRNHYYRSDSGGDNRRDTSGDKGIRKTQVEFTQGQA